MRRTANVVGISCPADIGSGNGRGSPMEATWYERLEQWGGGSVDYNVSVDGDAAYWESTLRFLDGYFDLHDPGDE